LGASTYFPWLVKTGADGKTSANVPGIIGMFVTVVAIIYLAKKLPVAKTLV
jgi:hypothetical protein